MKNSILHELKGNMNSYISGENLSRKLNVSRTAVWKYINELRRDGYIIESSSRKGYKLVNSPDILSEEEVSCNLSTSIIGRCIKCLDAVDSTNTYAKKAAFDGCAEGTVIVADRQTAGRGRLGREWISAGGKGIWMSVILRPSIVPQDVQIITLAASVAVVAAIMEEAGIRTGIKWPNDIILDGKKVCGILTEMNTEMERVNFIVLGIGINVNHSIADLPEALRGIATSLRIHSGEDTEGTRVFNRSRLIGRILYELEKEYKAVISGDVQEIADKWKEYSVTLGKNIRAAIKGIEYTGTAVDITNEGKLIMNCDDGVTREILSGEVTVRGILGEYA